MDEDDVIVIIVGDSGEENFGDGQIPLPIKTEQMDYLDDSDMVNLIKTAKKHGQSIYVKEEYLSDEETLEEYHEVNNDDMKLTEAVNSGKPLDQEFDSSKLISNLEELVKPKEEFLSEDEQGFDINFKEDYVSSDEDYVPDGYDEESKSDSENEVEVHSNRKSLLAPAQRKSFVQDLKQEYPELRHDNKGLVKALAEIMRNTQKPPLPPDFYYICDTMFECRKCGAMTETIPAAGRHYQERHGLRYLVCYACGVDFRSTTNLYKHEKRCSAPDIVTVLKARALSLGRKGRSRPFIPKPEDCILRLPISQKTFQCNECSATFTTKVDLDAHENLHKGLRPFRCHQCPCAYTSFPRLKRHMNQQHSGLQYICDYCGRVFKVKAALAVHLNTHAPEPKFPCPECPRRFATKAAMMNHLRGHYNLPPAFACPICPKNYPRMSLVRDHMKKIHGMSLMTRTMFFKALPRLTDEQLQKAKNILTSDRPLTVCEPASKVR